MKQTLAIVAGLLAFVALIAVSHWQDSVSHHARVGSIEYAIKNNPGIKETQP